MVFFLDFVTPEWLAELDDIGEENREELKEAVTAEVDKFIMRLPADGPIFNITLGTGDYAKGSTFGRRELGEKLVELIMSVIRSKGVQELQDFVVAVNAVYPKKPKRKPKKAAKKGRRK